jgi:ABC-2 type transport system permease protein
MVAFWTTRNNWATQIWWAIQTVAAGYLAPLAFFPSHIQKIISFTPFPITLQIPINIILNTVSTDQIVWELGKGVIWILVLGLLLIALWKKGIKKTEGIGM